MLIDFVGELVRTGGRVTSGAFKLNQPLIEIDLLIHKQYREKFIVR